MISERRFWVTSATFGLGGRMSLTATCGDAAPVKLGLIGTGKSFEPDYFINE
jgi:hypothetical protein